MAFFRVLVLPMRTKEVAASGAMGLGVIMSGRITFIITVTTVRRFRVNILHRVVEQVQDMMHKLQLQRVCLVIEHTMISGDVVKRG